ncbi:putative RDD family membrane protein YckC [Pseudoduganella lurida]|uniref:Putative RDD family membrane protein YckC n=1 Tax=Pseudoduganella lurida TaxID=1036180 RepID=A0A562QX68_9BURK|nr:RDD family protein [Pseudoduganella lurida]TWI60914.1 putative RDD family membrane protein YckC [Pseudoduganella lurida]
MSLDGRISLTTPEGVRLLLTPAGPAIRALAWGLDMAIWVTAAVTFSALLGNDKLSRGVFLLALFLFYWAYPVLFEVYSHGATPGKKIAGIEVVRDNGLPVGWRESALRNLLSTADFLPLLYATGLLCMLFDTRFRRVGDLAAGTVVIYRDRKLKRMDAAPDVVPLPPPWPLTPVQQSAVADLFAREKTLAADRMEELATLAEPLTGRTGAASLERLRGIAAGLAR